MAQIKTYIIRLIAAAVLCAMASALVKNKGISAGMMKLLCGVIMTLTMLTPLLDIRITDLTRITADYRSAAKAAVADGENAATHALADSIKAAAESYILDKAAIYDAAITVEVTVSADPLPIPTGVRIAGRVSPYGKKMLKEEIVQKLGVAEEDQIWTQ